MAIKASSEVSIADVTDAWNRSPTEPDDKTCMWLDTSQDPPILKSYNEDNESWDVVSDMGGVNESIKNTEQKFASSIATESNNILTTVSERYYEKEMTDSMIKELETSFKQDSTSFEMKFSEFKKEMENAIDGTTAEFGEIYKYIRFVDGDIILGKAGNELTLKITNDRIVFIQNDNEVAYFSDRKLYVTDGEYTNSLQLGNFAFIPRSSGNLSFKKVK